MVFWLANLGGLAIAYLLGSTPTAYVAGKLLKGIDIREHGSKSGGATNALRVLGAFGEADAPKPRVAAALAGELESMASWLGLGGFSVAGRGDLSGELRAAGDVLVDQLPFMRRCGFDSFAPEAEIDADVLRRSLARYTRHYQPAADAAVPVWKLRHG